MLASIMMVTFNRLDLTKQALNNIFETTHHPFELIIVDNGSEDKTVDYLQALDVKNENFKGFNIKKNEKNLGIAVGRNQALHMATGEWLSTVDNDVLLPDDWLSECIEILQFDKRYGMFGVNFEGVNFPIVKRGEKEWQEKIKGNLGTACTVFNRSLHKMLGYFNTEYGFYGMEDSDWGMRVRVLGLKMGYLTENGKHLGEGENDKGAYRQFKTEQHQANLNKFHNNCAAYVHGKKALYINWSS